VSDAERQVDGPGPDILICGSARAGTSYLASLLGADPRVDPGAVKEPNFYSREWHRGIEWYERLYEPRRKGLLRLDASVSYTFAHFPAALVNVAAHAPGATVVYSVRDPIQRLLSHYLLHRTYFRNDDAPTLGAALTGRDVYSGASDYAHWLGALYALFPVDRVLVVPFDIVTTRPDQVVSLVLETRGLGEGPSDQTDSRAGDHRNEVVEFRNPALRRAWRAIHVSGAYPHLRRLLGIDRTRRLRGLMTRTSHTERLPEALTSCTREQLLALDRLYASAQVATAQALAGQDARTGHEWAAAWAASCPASGSRELREALESRRQGG
jgi:hypothetical protein